MSLSPRPGSGISRSSREKRAFRLVVIGGTGAAVAGVGFLLAIFGVVGFGIPFLGAVVAGISALIFRRTVGT